MVTIGQMRQVVTFVKNAPVSDGIGGQLPGNDNPFVTTRGCLEKRSAFRNVETGQLIETGEYVLTCRFQTELEAELDMTVIAKIDNKEYSISSWKLVDEKRFYYQFIVNERKPQ